MYHTVVALLPIVGSLLPVLSIVIEAKYKSAELNLQFLLHTNYSRYLNLYTAPLVGI